MNKNNWFIFFTIFIFAFAANYALAQVNDAGVWASINVEKKINSKVALQLSEEVRFNENVSEVGTAFTEIGANYKLSKYIAVGVSYRFIQKRKVDDFYSFRHRYNVDVAFKYKYKKLSMSLRERLQTQYANVNSSEDGKVATRYLRNKLTLKYNLERKYTPFVAGELFYQLTNVEGNEFDNVRYTVGVDYEINKKVSLELFYLINKEFNTNNPVTDYVSGFGFTYTF